MSAKSGSALASLAGGTRSITIEIEQQRAISELARSRATIVYVDARNLYHALLAARGLAWFDVERYFRQKYSSFSDLRKIKYFTSPGLGSLSESLRQYHEALLAIRKNSILEIFLGRNQGREEHGCDHPDCMFLRKLPPQRDPLSKEKQTDVALAIEVLTDVITSDNGVKTILLVSDDSDFVPLIRKLKWLRTNRPQYRDLTVIVRSPGNPCQELMNEADEWLPLSRGDIQRFKMPNTFRRVIGGREVTFNIPRRFRIRELMIERDSLISAVLSGNSLANKRIPNCLRSLIACFADERHAISKEMRALINSIGNRDPKDTVAQTRKLHSLTKIDQELSDKLAALESELSSY